MFSSATMICMFGSFFFSSYCVHLFSLMEGMEIAQFLMQSKILQEIFSQRNKICGIFSTTYMPPVKEENTSSNWLCFPKLWPKKHVYIYSGPSALFSCGSKLKIRHKQPSSKTKYKIWENNICKKTMSSE